MMKHLFVMPLAVLLFAACAQPKDHFVLRGYVPGAKDSTEVELFSDELGELASGYVIGEKFELKGRVGYPQIVRLSMNDLKACGREDDARYVEANFFVENGNLTFRTADYDSLPGCFWNYDAAKEVNYTVKGSPAQDVYARYQQICSALEAANHACERAFKKSNRIEDLRAARQMKEELDRRTTNFIREHDHLYVNLFLGKKLLKEPFTYDLDYVKSMQDLFNKHQDTCEALQDFRVTIVRASHFVQTLQDARLLNPKGDTVALLSSLGKGRYTLIDFWASWCGPCRASFPHLQQMYKQYGDKMQFLSVSVDKKNSEWQQAMKEEQLPWPQLLTTPEFSKAMGRLYSINAVPTFLLIDPKGKIIFSGHESGELELKLEEIKL